MRRSSSVWAAGVCAAVVFVAGCSTTVQGSPEVGSAVVSSTTVSSSSAVSSTTDSSATESSDTDTSTSDTSASDTSTPDTSTSDTPTSESTTAADTSTSSSSGSAGAATLDATTEKWFTAFCDGATDLQQYVSPDTTGQTVAQAQDTVVRTYTNISKSASTTVGVLQATRPPTVPGGDDLQSIAIERFTAVSDVYGRGAQTIAALTPRSTSDLKSAVDAVEAEAKASTPDSMASVDPEVIAAARALPACKNVLG